MKMVKAVLKSLATEDGLCEMGDYAKIGDEYFIDLDSKRVLRWGHLDRDSEQDRVSVFSDASFNGGHAGWMPLEILEFEEPL